MENSEIYDLEQKPISEIIRHQINGIFNDSLLQRIITMWRGLEQPITQKSFQKYLEKANIDHMHMHWQIFFKLIVTTGAGLCMTENLVKGIYSIDSLVRTFFCGLFLLLFVTMNIWSDYCKAILNYVFVCYALFAGLGIVHCSILDETYVYSEYWGSYYGMIISIAYTHWQQGKLLIYGFGFIKAYFIIVTTYTYGILKYDFYASVFIIIVNLCVVCMTVTKISKDMIRAIYENKMLVEATQNILQQLPDGVLIEVFNPLTKQNVLNFVNTAAKEQLFRDIQDNIDFKLQFGKLRMKNSKEENTIYTLEELIEQNRRCLEDKEKGKACTMEVEAISLNDDPNEAKHFTLKSVRTNWEKYNTAFLHVIIDSTNIKNLEKEKATNKCLHLMFSSASHELRTPINAFSNALNLIEFECDIVRKKVSELSQEESGIKENIEVGIQKCQKFFNISKISIATLTSITEDILDMAKLEAGIFTLNEQDFLLKDLVQQIDFIFRLQLEQRGIEFIVEVEKYLLNTKIKTDFSRVRQILINLMSNAFKFTNIGKIILKIRRYNEKLEFKVIDTGVGMNQNEQRNLFKMFGIMDMNRRVLSMKGTGIGLTISKKLAIMLRGDIKVSSEEGQGSEFTLIIHCFRDIVQFSNDCDSLLNHMLDNPSASLVKMSDIKPMQLSHISKNY